MGCQIHLKYAYIWDRRGLNREGRMVQLWTWITQYGSYIAVVAAGLMICGVIWGNARANPGQYKRK